jgi:hypothetical protein
LSTELIKIRRYISARASMPTCPRPVEIRGQKSAHGLQQSRADREIWHDDSHGFPNNPGRTAKRDESRRVGRGCWTRPPRRRHPPIPIPSYPCVSVCLSRSTARCRLGVRAETPRGRSGESSGTGRLGQGPAAVAVKATTTSNHMQSIDGAAAAGATAAKQRNRATGTAADGERRFWLVPHHDATEVAQVYARDGVQCSEPPRRACAWQIQ